MWTSLAHIIIKYRYALLASILVVTIFMANQARKIELTYDFAQIVPDDDPDMIYLREFKKTFGEDGTVMAIGLKDESIFEKDKFIKLQYLDKALSQIEGVDKVLSIASILNVSKNTAEKKFEYLPVFTKTPDSQEELDSLLAIAGNIKFYEGQVINSENGALLVIITLEKDYVNSAQRDPLIADIRMAGDQFTDKTGIELHYAGIPYVRSEVSNRVKEEFSFFLYISLAVCATILFLFFRSFTAVLVPMLLIGVIVVWTMGTIVLLGYKLTLLTALLPPIIVVIGIPNSIYLINKYHQEFSKHGIKLLALSRIIRKIGIVTLITNFTTAIGFGVLTSTDIAILTEFGLVASINIMATFVVSIILIPATFALLPEPSAKHLKHLEFRFVGFLLEGFDVIVHKYRPAVYISTLITIVVSVYGLTKIEAISYMVDDLPKNSPIIKDLHFFEQNFAGIMPLEIIVDTNKKRGTTKLNNLQLVDQFDEFIDSIPNVSKSVSMLNVVKAANYAFYNQNPDFYQLPSKRDRAFLYRYLKNTQDSTQIANSFIDSAGQKMRLSYRIEDMGSIRLNELINEKIIPKAKSLFEGTDLEMMVTGTTLIFIKGNSYLIQNLLQSMIIAFVLIAIIMAILFQSVRMILISIIPNTIPLLVTAGIMGYFGIHLKPSTALIFSIAFGISVDDSIHYLAKYRQELLANGNRISKCVSISLLETGSSMMYTSIVLFAGFIIFAFSDFGGTVALGVLTSLTLLVALLINLIILPSLIMSFDKGLKNRDAHPLIEMYDEFYYEHEDEEIDLSQMSVRSNGRKSEEEFFKGEENSDSK
ncbi:MMPL family transporter [Hyphobacterium sp. CCMP332]|nr:MMPL family transporter [Hyphobacterium sp. CCMP332]